MLGEALLESMRQHGINVYTNYQAKNISLQKDGTYSIISENNTVISDIDTIISAIVEPMHHKIKFKRNRR